jgi:hypothetical protein
MQKNHEKPLYFKVAPTVRRELFVENLLLKYNAFCATIRDSQGRERIMKHSVRGVMPYRVRLLQSSFALFLAIGILPTQAQAAEQQTRSSAIEEVIVTAQKREESINDVGMSIQAATGEKLNELS